MSGNKGNGVSISALSYTSSEVFILARKIDSSDVNFKI